MMCTGPWSSPLSASDTDASESEPAESVDSTEMHDGRLFRSDEIRRLRVVSRPVSESRPGVRSVSCAEPGLGAGS